MTGRLTLLAFSSAMVCAGGWLSCALDWPDPLPMDSAGAAGSGDGGNGGAIGGGGTGGEQGGGRSCDRCGRFDGHFLLTGAADTPTFVVASDAELSEALANVRYGEVIAIDPAAELRQPIVLPNKDEDRDPNHRYITIRSARWPEDFPSVCERVTEAHRSAMPRISVPAGMQALQTEDGAHHYRVIGLEMTRDTDDPTGDEIVRVGRLNVESVDLAPHHIELVHLDVHGTTNVGPRFGVRFAAGEAKLMSSRIVDIRSTEIGGEVVGVYSGAGPTILLNNEIFGAGPLVSIGRNPTQLGPPEDVVVAYNVLTRDPDWVNPADLDNPTFAIRFIPALSIQAGSQIVVDGNLIEYAFESALVSFRPEVEAVTDIVLSNNHLRRGSFALQAVGTEATTGVTLDGNLITELRFFDHDAGFTERLISVLAPLESVVMRHNTMMHGSSAMISFNVLPTTTWLLNDNIVDNGFDDVGMPTRGIVDCTKTCTIFPFPGPNDGNVVVKGSAKAFPGDNCFPSTDAFFVDPASGDYRLTDGAPCAVNTTDGTDPGVDFAAFDAVSACRDPPTN